MKRALNEMAEPGADGAKAIHLVPHSILIG